MGLLMLPAITACSDFDDVNIYMERPADEMQLTASLNELQLDVNNEKETALTLTFNNATVPSETATLTYLYRIGLTDNIQNVGFEEITENTISYTNEDLNDMLQEWGVPVGTNAEVTAEVVAKVNDETKYHMPEISKASFWVVGYAPVSRPLWIVNPAVDKGVNPHMRDLLTDGNKMTEIVLGKLYRYTGWCEAGVGIKCVYNQETGLPSINRGEGPTDLVYRNDASQPDDLFYVPYDAYWEVTINTKTMTLSATTPSPWDHVYMVGNAMPCGWDIGNPTEFTRSNDNPALFYYEGHVNGDNAEMKAYFQTGGWGNDAFMPLYHGTDWNGDDNIDYVPGANPDKKWIITRGGEYRIEMNMNIMKIKFIPLD